MQESEKSCFVGNIPLYSFLTFHQICNKSDRACAINETGAVCHSGASDREFMIRDVKYLVFCVVLCQLLCFFLFSLGHYIKCLSFDGL